MQHPQTNLVSLRLHYLLVMQTAMLIW